MSKKCFVIESDVELLNKVLEDYKVRLNNPNYSLMFKNAIKQRIKELEEEITKLKNK